MMSLGELKAKAGATGYMNICLDAPGALPVNLAQWRGISTGETQRTYQGLPAVVTAQVAYHLEGNKVRAKRAGDKELWYVLS
jgi:hypothetical protein